MTEQDQLELTATGRVVVRRLDKLAVLIGQLIEVLASVDIAMQTDRRWQKRFAAVVAIGALFTLLTGIFMVITNTKIDRTTRSTEAAVTEVRDLNRTVEDCSNPEGKCFKDNAEANKKAAEEQARRSAALVQEAKDEIIARTEAELQKQIDALRRELRIRTSPTTTLPPRTTTTRPPTPTTTTPSQRPSTTSPPATAPPNLLCVLLNIDC